MSRVVLLNPTHDHHVNFNNFQTEKKLFRPLDVKRAAITHGVINFAKTGFKDKN